MTSPGHHFGVPDLLRQVISRAAELPAETVVNDPELGAARARQHIPSVDVQIYPGSGHDLLWANQEVVIPRFLDFADNHDQVRN